MRRCKILKTVSATGVYIYGARDTREVGIMRRFYAEYKAERMVTIPQLMC